MDNYNDYIKLMRPQQWLKNLFVFLPVFFGNYIMEWGHLYPVIITFAAFCLLSSSVYCFNDIQDCAMDKLHPVKKFRPLARGSISVAGAYVMMVLLALMSCCIMLYAELYKVLYIAAIYYTVNLAYCVKLKNIPIVDIFLISSGFVLRIISGGLASNIELSKWIVLMTFLLSLFLAFSKRLDDSRIYMKRNIKLRKNISSYNPDFIQLSLAIVSSITIVCYIMYSIDESVVNRIQNNYLYVTSIFVILGILRFLQLVVVEKKCYSPTKMLIKDRFIQVCIALWTIMFLVMLYFN